MIRQWLCWFGLHYWSNWKQEDVEINYVHKNGKMVETRQSRFCIHCNFKKFRKVL